MSSISFIKRMVPFLAAFSIGIFIASFFVAIGGSRESRRGSRHRLINELRIENQRLQEENQSLRDELQRGRGHRMNWQARRHHCDRDRDMDLELPVPPPPISDDIR